MGWCKKKARKIRFKRGKAADKLRERLPLTVVYQPKADILMPQSERQHVYLAAARGLRMRHVSSRVAGFQTSTSKSDPKPPFLNLSYSP